MFVDILSLQLEIAVYFAYFLDRYGLRHHFKMLDFRHHLQKKRRLRAKHLLLYKVGLAPRVHNECLMGQDTQELTSGFSITGGKHFRD